MSWCSITFFVRLNPLFYFRRDFPYSLLPKPMASRSISLLACLIVSNFAVVYAQILHLSNTTSGDAALVPWSWVLKPDTAQPFCSLSRWTLGTFATVNDVVSVLHFAIGNRAVLNQISRGMWGKPRSKSWRYMWVSTFGTQFSASALVAYLYRVTLRRSGNWSLFSRKDHG